MTLNNADFEKKLVKACADYADKPYQFVMFMFPWGIKGTPLQDSEGPDSWQKKVLLILEREIAKGKDPTLAARGAIQVAVTSGHGIGKVLSYNTIVETPTGARKWNDIQVGDSLFGTDGNITKVTARHNHKKVVMYKMTFDDGSSIECCEDHQWSVRGRNDRRTNAGFQTLDTKSILAKGVKRPNGKALARQWEIPRIKPVEYPEAELKVHPYTMGVWLGDGCRNKSHITCSEHYIVKHLIEVGEKITMGNRQKNEVNISMLAPRLKSYSCANCLSYDKHIPEEYKRISVKQRSELLRGLLDTDGECGRDNGSVGYSSTSKQLCEDVMWLVRSLGGKAMMQPTAKVGKIGDKEYRECYRVTINMPNDFQCFYVKRKQERVKPSEDRYLSRWIESIEPIPNADGMCVTVDAPDSCYLANDFIVTHNTGLVAMIIYWFISTRVNPQIVVTANTSAQLDTKTWRELAKWHKMALNTEWFKWTATKFYHKDNPETWFASAIPWSEDNPEAFAGTHEKHVLIIFDEASGIADIIWEVVQGALTTEGAIWIAFGNPTRNSGRFFECFNRFKHRWITLKVDSRTAKLANKAQLDEWIEDYGEDSDFARVRIKGEFPRAGSSQLISSEDIEACVDYVSMTHEGQPIVIGVDVARYGDDQSVILIRQGRKIKDILKFRNLSTMEFADKVAQQIKMYDPIGTVVDVIGIGAGVVDRLRQLNYSILACNVAKPAYNKEKYFNKRAEMYGNLNDVMKEGLDIPRDTELITDLRQIEYFITQTGKLQLEKKEDMKKRGLSSPDVADALALTYAEKIEANHLRNNKKKVTRAKIDSIFS